MTRIVLVDDHAIVRRGLRGILEENPGFQVVGEGGDWGELRRVLRESAVDVVVLDIGLPGRSGIEIVQSLAEEHPTVKVLMLSIYPEDQYGLRALKSGAAGYLNKSSAPEELVRAVETVASGRKYVSGALAQALVDNLTGAADEAPHERLSNREFQTLCLIAQGKRLADIAETLALSPKTVSVYRARILEKMGLANNAELTHYALKNRLVE
jgi:two-component system invasion response regulator UvrY